MINAQSCGDGPIQPVLVGPQDEAKEFRTHKIGRVENNSVLKGVTFAVASKGKGANFLKNKLAESDVIEAGPENKSGVRRNVATPVRGKG
jgi:hypothetical protein